MRAVELFCGAGGMSLGLRRAGVDMIQAYDAWSPAVETYCHNIGYHVSQRDLKDIFTMGPVIADLSPDLICGGPPCQDYSVAGKRIEGENAGLTKAFAMLVCIARPEWFVMENVPQAARSVAWEAARAMLVKAGYGLSECKLDASWYGVAQKRKRLFVIGRLGEQHGFLNSALVAARTKTQTVINDVLDIAEGYVYSRPFRAARGVRSVHEPFPTVTRTCWERLTERYLSNPHPNDPVPVTEAAVLTTAQLAQLQGFPEHWQWRGATRQDIHQMIANAVPSPLAESIGRVIMERHNSQTIPMVQGRFVQFLMKKGRSYQSARNVKSQLNRARRLLGGRTFTGLELELATLESIEQFIALSIRTKSDLRAALRNHWDYQKMQQKQPKREETSVILQRAA
ncbi:DNA cytosine methyltransferase [Paenochrobactrum gallinarii]